MNMFKEKNRLSVSFSLALSFVLSLSLCAPASAADAVTHTEDEMLSITGQCEALDAVSFHLPDYYCQVNKDGDLVPEPELWSAPAYRIQTGASATLDKDTEVFYVYYALSDPDHPGAYLASDHTAAGGGDPVRRGDVTQIGSPEQFMDGDAKTGFAFAVPGQYLLIYSDDAYAEMGYTFDVVFQTLNAVFLDVTGEAPEHTAVPASISMVLDQNPIRLESYALLDAKGNPTNYIKLRDLAYLLNGTEAQFNVGWDGAINIESKTPYTSTNGTEMTSPFTGRQPYTDNTSPILIDGVSVELEAVTLTDAQGNGHTYFKLRDLGEALDFNVSWDGGISAVVIDTASPYSSES